MSKRAVSFILTFVLTISLFLVSALTAFGEELNPETAAVSEEGTGTDPLLSEDTSIPITTENQTTKLDFPLLTVNAISNYFGKVYSEYNEFTKEISVTYYFKASKKILTTQWSLGYDSSVLSFDPEKNPASFICPAMKNGAVVDNDAENGCVMFRATNLRMYDYSTNELIFARVVFDIKDLPTEVPEFTKIDLTVLELWTSEPSPSTGLAVDDRNIILVSDGDVSRTKESDSVLVSKYTKLTASTFTEDNIRKSTKDQAVGTEPKSEPVTVPTSVAVVEKSDKGDKNEDDSAFVKTGKWYIALLILAVLIVCSTVLFVMRKRDIYDN